MRKDALTIWTDLPTGSSEQSKRKLNQRYWKVIFSIEEKKNRTLFCVKVIQMVYSSMCRTNFREKIFRKGALKKKDSLDPV